MSVFGDTFPKTLKNGIFEYTSPNSTKIDKINFKNTFLKSEIL